METPAINNMSYVSNTLTAGDLFGHNVYTKTSGGSGYHYYPMRDEQQKLDELMKQLPVKPAQAEPIKEEKKKMADKPTRRLVRVIIVDADENLPLDKCLLYQGQETFTDLTDQELFFEIDIKPLLDKHNDYRKAVVDKKLTQKLGKDAFLEPVKIRDLKMTVVEIAVF